MDFVQTLTFIKMYIVIISISLAVILLNQMCDGMVLKQDVTLNESATQKAYEHNRRMRNKICSAPVPKLFQVAERYPIIHGRYKPHCVELHRCDNDAGCCSNDALTCAPAKVEFVNLHIGVSGQGRHKSKVYLMSFENHTRCECQTIGWDT